MTLFTRFSRYLALAILPLMVFVSSPQLSAQAIDDQTKNAACNAIGSTGGDCGTSGSNVNELIASTINILSFIVGVAAVIMLIVGGLKYITSSGDSNGITSAKNTILYALIGLAIAAVAQFIVRFVLNGVS